jgi:hypothetical protein
MKFNLQNKTIEAALRGYVVFEVNGKRYWSYNKALAARKHFTSGHVYFKGLHIFKGWIAFYYRSN